MTAALLQAARALSVSEALSVLLALAYLLLAVRRSRWCWVAGGASSAIAVVLALEHHVPMQALLNVYYVGVSVYGFRQWSGGEDATRQPPIGTWPLRWHLAACAAILALSAASARLLAGASAEAWPFLDSVTTWGSLFTTWLVARMKLENWLYWLVIDAALVYLFGAQRLYLFALLNLVYLAIVVAGLRSWLRSYRRQVREAPA